MKCCREWFSAEKCLRVPSTPAGKTGITMVPILPAWEWMSGLHSSGCQKRQILFFFF